MREEKARNSFAWVAWIGGIIFIIGTIFASGSSYTRLNEVEKKVESMQDLDTKVEVLNVLIPRLEMQISSLEEELKNKKDKK